MKIVVVGDSHGNYGNLKRIIERELPFDRAIHLGDGTAEMEMLCLKYGFSFNFEAVEGNNDPKDMYPETLKLVLGSVPILLTHGHGLQVHLGYEALVVKAKREKCRIVMFGHTHRYCDETVNGVRLLNPGSVCPHLSRDPGYLVLEVEGKNLTAERKLLFQRREENQQLQPGG